MRSRSSRLTVAAQLALGLAFLLGVLALIGCSNRGQATSNVVTQYLTHADRQYETAEQRTEIMRALRDMLDKSPSELQNQRYSDYQGNKGAWPVTTLLERYFVPTQPDVTWKNPEEFYRDVSKPEAQEAIRQQLSGLEKEAAAH